MRYVVYHHPCMDGFTAAWCAHRAFGEDAEFLPWAHGDDIPLDVDVLCPGDDVYFLDIAPRSVEELCKVASVANVHVLDHHATAIERFADAGMDGRVGGNVRLLFDIDRSGATIAWSYFFPEEPIPLFLQYVEDADLWRWEMPYSKQICAVIYAVERTFDGFDDDVLVFPEAFDQCIMLGNAVNAHIEHSVDWNVEMSWLADWGEYTVAVANCTYEHSMVGSVLLDRHPQADLSATFRVVEDGVLWSFRSREGGVDVSKLAESLGGGGHPCASGCKTEGFGELSVLLSKQKINGGD